MLLLRLQAEKSDWKARAVNINRLLKTGQLPRNIHRRCSLALSEAKGVFAEGATLEAQEAAIEANRMSPDLVPAAVGQRKPTLQRI
jgi:HemY protein